LTSQILNTFKNKVQEMVLVPGKGGCFEVTVNGELIYSKLKTGKFPEETDVIALLKARAG
jgi:selenoprotein W-related protein